MALGIQPCGAFYAQWQQALDTSKLGTPRSVVGCLPASARGWATVLCEGEGTSQPRKGFGTEVKKGGKQGSSKGPVTKGIGNKGDKRAISVREGSKQLQNVLKAVEKESADERSKGLGIDPEAAAKGKVDFVRVQSWGSEGGGEQELDNLRLKSFSPAFSSEETDAPFYEQLVRRLQLLDSKGELSVAQARPLPPFERWSFSEDRYLQFLQDQHAVYEALREVIAAVKKSIINDGAPSTGHSQVPDSRAATAIAVFDTPLGLDRSEVRQGLYCKGTDQVPGIMRPQVSELVTELTADISSLSRAATGRSGTPKDLPVPTIQTTAYVKYLRQIGRGAAQEKDGSNACLRLMAHIFAIHVAHLTTGMRVGAKAVECMSILAESKAVRFYRDYPPQARDPLRVFIAAVNSAGSSIALADDHEQVMQELPKAMQKTSLLFSVLAVEEQSHMTT